MKQPENGRTIRIHEYEDLAYSDLKGGAARLEKTVSRLGVPVFRFYRNHAQASQYVGVVSTGRDTIEILPKVHEGKDENLSYLISLLGYTRRLRLKSSGAAGFEKMRGSFLEVLIRHFATELRRLLRTQHRLRYMDREDRTTFLRGKLLTERELDGSGRLYVRYACRYEEFTPDHPLNRVLKYCNRLLSRQTRVPATRKILRENDALLSEVSGAAVSAATLDAIHLDRLNRDYEGILALCRLVLQSCALDLKSGHVEQLAYVFDMNKLFEEFVERFLTANMREIHVAGKPLVRVERQKKLGRLFDEFDMNVDLILHNDAGERFLVDTKYKRLDRNKKHQGISQSDFYQMHAYGTAGDRGYENIVLLYPSTDPSIPISLRRTQLTSNLYVRQFDVRGIFDPQTGKTDNSFVIRQLNDALRLDYQDAKKEGVEALPGSHHL